MGWLQGYSIYVCCCLVGRALCASRLSSCITKRVAAEAVRLATEPVVWNCVRDHGQVRRIHSRNPRDRHSPEGTPATGQPAGIAGSAVPVSPAPYVELEAVAASPMTASADEAHFCARRMSAPSPSSPRRWRRRGRTWTRAGRLAAMHCRAGPCARALLCRRRERPRR